MLISYKKKS